MGRGSGDQRDLAKRQLEIQNQMVQDQKAEREQGRAMLMPAVSELQNSEGYSGSEKAAITGRTMDANTAAFNAGGQQIRNRTARTRNSAGVNANLSEMASQRSGQQADLTRGLTQGFADEKQRRRMAGNQLAANMYGIDTNLMSNVAGLPIQALNQHAAGISKGLSLGPFGTWG